MPIMPITGLPVLAASAEATRGSNALELMLRAGVAGEVWKRKSASAELRRDEEEREREPYKRGASVQESRRGIARGREAVVSAEVLEAAEKGRRSMSRQQKSAGGLEQMVVAASAGYCVVTCLHLHPYLCY